MIMIHIYVYIDISEQGVVGGSSLNISTACSAYHFITVLAGHLPFSLGESPAAQRSQSFVPFFTSKPWYRYSLDVCPNYRIHLAEASCGPCASGNIATRNRDKSWEHPWRTNNDIRWLVFHCHVRLPEVLSGNKIASNNPSSSLPSDPRLAHCLHTFWDYGQTPLQDGCKKGAASDTPIKQ